MNLVHWAVKTVQPGPQAVAVERRKHHGDPHEEPFDGALVQLVVEGAQHRCEGQVEVLEVGVRHEGHFDELVVVLRRGQGGLQPQEVGVLVGRHGQQHEVRVCAELEGGQLCLCFIPLGTPCQAS